MRATLTGRLSATGNAGKPIPSGILYPTLLSAPISQFQEISQNQPALNTPVQFDNLDTAVVRITDSDGAHHYSTWQAFNRNQSKVLINTASGGLILNTADWSTIASSLDIGAVLCFWDPVDSDILWAHDGLSGGSSIYKYRISTSSSTQYTIPGGYSGISIGGGEGSISSDGRWLALIGTKGTSDRFVIVFDTQSESVENTLTLSGWDTYLDNAHISQSGDYVVVASYYAGNKGHRIYDRATLTFQRAYTGGAGTDGSTGFPGHMDIGYRTNGDECMVRSRNDGALVSVRLSDGDEQLEIDSSAMTWAFHVSCRNINRRGYAYISALYQADQSSKYLYREVFAVKLDGSGAIERFGQSVFPESASYDLQAKATVSPLGDMVLMSSGWNTTTAREFVMYVPKVMPNAPAALGVGRGVVGASGTAITTSPGTTHATESSFMVCVSWENGALPTSVTDNKGNTYTQLGSLQNSGASPRAAQYLCENGVGGDGHAATVNFDASGIYGVAHLIEIVGCISSPLDKHVQATDATSPYTVDTGTLTSANEVVVSFFAPATSANPTTLVSSNLAILSAETDGSTYWASAVGAAVVSSTSSVSASFTGNGLSATAAVSVTTFKAAG